MTTTPSKTQTHLSQEERKQVIRLIIKLISLSKDTTDIKQAVSEKYNLSRRSVERYITSARREMVKQVNLPPEVHRAESLYFYLSVINDPKSTQRDRIRARERIDRLLDIDLSSITQARREFDRTAQEIHDLSDEEFQDYYNKKLKELGVNPKSSLFNGTYQPS
ncbi:hypothetical protein Pan153_22200 [Gimesia panareensis]|uniref:Uncharacterized protein n=1 Tax=Gimesia panareensis TaxID=2527978 RepID=A0A518FMN2_9PLAN|nr:hypothetical protein [Gimesia panareensis]QDV17567.1 hypothetical protein Pan153_22200 [Gimesia panareensis]